MFKHTAREEALMQFFIVASVTLSAIIVVPSMALYLAETCVLIGYPRRFNGSFYTLVVARFAACVINFFSSLVMNRMAMLGIGREWFLQAPRHLLAAIFIGQYYSFQVENMITMFILLNRYTAVVAPIHHVRIWRNLMPIALLLTFGLPLVAVSPNFVRHFYIHTANFSRFYAIDYERNASDDHLWGNSYTSAVGGALFCAICVALNIATYMAYRRRSSMVAVQVTDDVEWRLTVYGVCTFVSQLLMVAYFVIMIISTKWLGAEVVSGLAYMNQCWVNDLCVVAIPAWLLLWASADLRRELLHLLRGAVAEPGRFSLLSLTTNSTLKAVTASRLSSLSNAGITRVV